MKSAGHSLSECLIQKLEEGSEEKETENSERKQRSRGIRKKEVQNYISFNLLPKAKQSAYKDPSSAV